MPRNNRKPVNLRQQNNKRGGRRPRGKGVSGVRGGGGAVSGRNAVGGYSFSVQEPGMNIGSMPLFGDRTRRNLPYASNFLGASSGAGTAGAYVYSANGIFDPNITGTGGQPMGFDQMMLFYNHYTVLRSKIRVIASAGSAVSPCVGIATSGTSTPLTSVEQIMEVGRVNFIWLNPTGIAQSKAVLRCKCDVGRFQGIQNIMDDPDMRGDVAANPAEQVYYIIYVWNPVDNTVVSANFSVLLEYDVMFHEPRSASLSLKSQELENKRWGSEEHKVEVAEFVELFPGKSQGLANAVAGFISNYHSCPVALLLDQMQIKDKKEGDG